VTSASSEHSSLLELLRSRSFEQKEFTLTSGRKSDFFIDCKQAVLTAEGHAWVGALMLEGIDALELPAGKCPQAVAGVELGGCSLASAVSLTSFLRGAPLPALYVRKDAKEHGSRRLVEGDPQLLPGAPQKDGPLRAVILEDVITTGGSTLKAVDKLRQVGADVVGVVVLVDRLEGGRQAIEGAGLTVTSIFTRDDFIPPKK